MPRHGFRWIFGLCGCASGLELRMTFLGPVWWWFGGGFKWCFPKGIHKYNRKLFEEHWGTTKLCVKTSRDSFPNPYLRFAVCTWLAILPRVPKKNPWCWTRWSPSRRVSGGREILCRSCGGHLGHVFMDGQCLGGDGPERHCVNSMALVYVAGTKHRMGDEFFVERMCPKMVGFVGENDGKTGKKWSWGGWWVVGDLLLIWIWGREASRLMVSGGRRDCPERSLLRPAQISRTAARSQRPDSGGGLPFEPGVACVEEWHTEGYFFFPRQVLFFFGSWFYAFLYLWFSASQLFCFSAYIASLLTLLLCLHCCSAFPASLLFCFLLSLLLCFSAFLLFLLLSFSASLFSLLLCFCTSVPFYFYYSTVSLSRHVFLLLYFLLLCFFASCLYCLFV